MKSAFSNTFLALVAIAMAGASDTMATSPHAHGGHNHNHLARRQTAPHIVPTGWMQQAAADPKDEVQFAMALKGEHFDSLAAKMEEIAAQGDGKWLSDEQLAHYTRPSEKDKKAFNKYLADHGLKPEEVSWSRHGDHATIKTNVATASKMFNQPSMYRFNDTSTGKTHVKTQSLNIPPHLSFVQHVTGLTSFPPRGRKKGSSSRFKPLSPAAIDKLTADGGGDCDDSQVTGTCIRSLYGVDDSKPKGKGGDGPAVLIMGYQDQYASQVRKLRSASLMTSSGAIRLSHVSSCPAPTPHLNPNPTATDY